MLELNGSFFVGKIAFKLYAPMASMELRQQPKTRLNYISNDKDGDENGKKTRWTNRSL